MAPASIKGALEEDPVETVKVLASAKEAAVKAATRGQCLPAATERELSEYTRGPVSQLWETGPLVSLEAEVSTFSAAEARDVLAPLADRVPQRGDTRLALRSWRP